MYNKYNQCWANVYLVQSVLG